MISSFCTNKTSHCNIRRWVDHQNLFHETMELPKSAKPPAGKLLSREKPEQALKQQSEIINK